MFGITYETWESVCSMYFNLKGGTQKAYLQLFPFSKLSSSEKEYLKSKEFFNSYINYGTFVMFPAALHQSENYLQKSDGSFRDSSLISPLLYLVLQSVGMEIFKKYRSRRPKDISVYYAGNYEYKRPMYKQDYDNFFKEVNGCINQYQYFIKTDISNFYSNINLDELINRIDVICNNNSSITQTQLLLYRKLLQYCGAGKFPLVDNSIASSFLATIVYLDSIDNELYKYINTFIKCFDSFKIVRYVDDMYILISSDKSICDLHKEFNEIRNEYSSILKKYGLALNAKKCCLRAAIDINEELKKSLYDEYFNDRKCNIENLFHGKLLEFLNMIRKCNFITIEKYNEIIEQCFNLPDIEFTANEVFNYFIYQNESELQSKQVIETITKLVEEDVSFISLDAKRLTVMIMKTHSDKAIKTFLNQLFKRHRADKWNSYDTTIAISYLIQSRFAHIDLLSIIKNRNPQLYYYYKFYCKKSFCYSWKDGKRDKVATMVNDDSKTYFLYFMYLVEQQRKDYLAAFAYYKNYFDRLSAHIAYYTKYDNKGKKPNYNRFYKESDLIKLYSTISESKNIIQEAHALRNANPLSHASAGLIDNNKTSRNLSKAISSMDSLIFTFLKHTK